MTFIIFMAAINGLRGAGMIPRWIFFPAIFSVMYLLGFQWVYAAMWTLLLVFAYAFPWGNGLILVTWRDTRSYDRSDAWLVRLTNIIARQDMHKIMNRKECQKWGFVYMLLRGLWFVPAAPFLPLSYLNAALWSDKLGAQFRGEQGARIGEIIFGAMLASVIILLS